MKSKTYITKSAKQTRQIGEKMARELVCGKLGLPHLPREKSMSPTTILNLGERWGSAPASSSKGAARAVRKHAITLAMQGDLGGGKTTFIQGLARGLGIKENITSPTFVILKKFEIPSSLPVSVIARRGTPRRGNLIQRVEGRDCRVARAVALAPRNDNFYHIDCYRIEKPKDLLDLGVENILSDRNNIIAIEWSEKIQKILPKNAIKIKFEFVDENTRKITIK